MKKIRHNHPDLKGSFTALGVWFNCLHKDEIKRFEKMIKNVSCSDRRQALKEFKQAINASKNWKPVQYMNWFYKEYENENKDI